MTKKPRKREVNVNKNSDGGLNTKSKVVNKKNRLRKVLYFTSVFLLFVVGLTLIFHQSITNKIVDSYAQEYVNNTSPDQMKENENADVSFDAGNVGALTSADVLAEMTSGRNHYTDLPVIGAIAIPDLGVNLPILKGLDNASLAVGAGTMRENQKMGEGNYSLASHSLFYGWGYENLLFSPLHRAQEGQLIYIRDSEKIYVYKTEKVFNVNPEDGWVTHDSEGDKLITLVTCTDTYAIQRLIVRGSLVSSYPIKEASQELKDYFGSDWNRWY
jgi:sortase family protein